MEIRNWKTGNIIYQAEVSTIKELVEKAVKEGVNLNCADLRCTYLSDAILRGANLHRSDLSYADLRNADLRDADLSDAILRGADLRNANLYGANLIYANLCRADLSDADLRDSILYGAVIRHAKNVSESLPMACPKEGSFVGWKKVKDKLVKIEIPEDAKRSSATSNKCRCSKAKVLEITDLDGTNPIDEVVNQNYNQDTVYRVGEMVYPDRFDDYRWNECSNGIHFFMNKQNAILY